MGAGLTLVGAIASIWLAATGQLSLYVHPRYTFLTVVMSVIAVLAVTLANALPSGNGHDGAADLDHGHEISRDEGQSGLVRSRPVLSTSRAVIFGCAVLALLMLTPATLTASTRQSRDLVTSGQTLDSTDTTVLAGGNSLSFSVKDWSALLRQGGSEAVVAKEVDVTGYVLDQGMEDELYVVRMMVSCCAVDAQPVGIPVRRPGWRDEFRPSDWVAVKGTFVESAGTDSPDPAVVQPTEVQAIDEPDQPYVF